MFPEDSLPQECAFENSSLTPVGAVGAAIFTHWMMSRLRPPCWVISRWRSTTSLARTSTALSRSPPQPDWVKQPTILTSSIVAPRLTSATLPLRTAASLVPSASPRGVSVLQALRPFSWPMLWVPWRRQRTRWSEAAPAGLEATNAARDSLWPCTSSHWGWVVKVSYLVPLTVPSASTG